MGIFDGYIKHYNDEVVKRFKEDRESKRLRADYEDYLQPPPDDLASKHAVMDALIKFLDDYDKYGVKRSAKQIEFHNIMLATVAVTVYGYKLFKKYERSICARYNWSKEQVYHMLSIMASRRFGKTHAFAMFIAAFIAVVPKAECNIFAPTDAQSNMLLDYTKYYFKMRCASEFKIETEKKRHFSVSNGKVGDVRKVHAWPKGVNVSLKISLLGSYGSSTFFYLRHTYTNICEGYKCKIVFSKGVCSSSSSVGESSFLTIT